VDKLWPPAATPEADTKILNLALPLEHSSEDAFVFVHCDWPFLVSLVFSPAPLLVSPPLM